MVLDEVIAARMEENGETPRISKGDDIGLARIVANIKRVERSYLRFGGACLVYLRAQVRLQNYHIRQLPGPHSTTWPHSRDVHKRHAP